MTGEKKLIVETNPEASFDQAFAAARSAGAQEFIWRGNRYHTRRTDDPKPDAGPVIIRSFYGE